MSRRYTVLQDALALVAATAQGIELATPSTVARVPIVEFGITFNGVNAAAVPVAADWIKHTSTGTGSAFTPLANGGAPAGLVTCKAPVTTIGTGSVVVWYPYYVPPTSGLILQWPLGRELIEMMASEFWTLRLTAPANVSVKVYIAYEE